MPNSGIAFFIERPRRIDELICPQNQERQEYEVVKTIRLAKIDYDNFVTDMAADRQFLEDNAALCGFRGNVVRCLRVIGRGNGMRILVVPEKAWVHIAALEPETPTKHPGKA